MMLLYSAVLTLGLLLSGPWWLFRMFTTERYREGLAQRLGRVPQQLREAVRSKRVIWLHAVSVGEVLAATRLVAELETSLGEGWRVVVSTTTRTGQALARARFGSDRVFYFPLDFAFAVRSYTDVLKPAALVLMESELWPRVLHEFHHARSPVIVVNARVSDRSFARGARARVLWGRMLRKVSLWLTQSEEDARRLVAMGAKQDSVRVGGNLKYDVTTSGANAIAQQIKVWAGDRSIVVAGSTCALRDGNFVESEEPLLAEAAYTAVREQNRALLVIAPRHPERFDEAESAVATFWYRFASGKPAQNPSESHAVEVVILDTIGDLASVYAVADVAFVGGSLVRRGGHNPLEPAQFGVPVIIGPSYENFRNIVDRMKEADAIRILKSDSELEGALTTLLNHPETAKAMGERGRRVFEAQQGATKRAVEAIEQLVHGAAV